MVVAFILNVIFCNCYALSTEPLSSDQLVAFKQLFDQGENFEITENGEASYYTARSNSDILGYIFIGSHKGFMAEIITYTGIDIAGTCRGLTIFHQQETPRYFNLIIEDKLIEKFQGIDISNIDPEDRNFKEYNIDVVTGATSSSSAIIENFWDAVELFNLIP